MKTVKKPKRVRYVDVPFTTEDAIILFAVLIESRNVHKEIGNKLYSKNIGKLCDRLSSRFRSGKKRVGVI